MLPESVGNQEVGIKVGTGSVGSATDPGLTNERMSFVMHVEQNNTAAKTSYICKMNEFGQS
jgi:hypothetical protein